MQHAQHTYQIAIHVIDQYVVVMRYDFAGASDTTRPTQVGMINQTAGLLCKQFVERQGSDGVVRVM